MLNENDENNENKRKRGGRAVLIICENKKDVADIIKTLSVEHKHLFEYKGKIDGMRKVIDGFQRTKIDGIRQVRPCDIIVATNVAGRGTDLKISELLERNGGLHVIVSYLPSNVRVELQAFGRSGRKGENGSGRMIVYDPRSAHNSLTFQSLVDERNQKEEDRLQEIRIKMIPRVEIEKELFEKFELLQDNFKVNYFLDRDSKYKDLQMRALHNKWAFWLDKMSDKINNVYKSKENREEIFKNYDIFKENIINLLNSSFSDGREGLIDESGELLKLAKYNIEEANYKQAQKNCDKILAMDSDYSFAYYYKAIAICQPMKPDESIEIIKEIKKKWSGHQITFEEKRECISLLKKAMISFESEIENLQMRSMHLASLNREKRNAGIGTEQDFFSRSNSNEISAIFIHLNAIKDALTKELIASDLAKTLSNTFLTEQEAQQLFEYLIKTPELSTKVKNVRVSKKVKVKYHVSNKNEQILEIKQSTNNDCFKRLTEADLKSETIVLDFLTKGEKDLLDKNLIDFSLELYAADQLNVDNYKLVDFPKSFNFCKLKFLEKLEDSNKTTLEYRENLIGDLKLSALIPEKIIEILKDKTNQIETISLDENQKSSFETHDIWHDQNLLNESGNQLKVTLAEKLSNNKLTYKDFDDILSNLSNSIKSIKNENKTIIWEKLKQVSFIKCEQMFQFNENIRHSLDKYVKCIKVTKKINFDKIDFSGFNLLEKNSKEISSLFNEPNKTDFSEDDLVKIFLKDNSVSKEEAQNAFFYLRRYLVNKGIARNIIDELGLKLDFFDKNELIEIDGILEQLYQAKYFNSDSIELFPISNLIDELKKKRVIKGRSMKSKLIKGNEKPWIEYKNNLEKNLRRLTGSRINEIIDKRIADDKFVTETEIQQHTDGYMKRIKFAYKKKTFIFDSNVKDNEKKIKTDLIETKKNSENEKITDAVVNAFMESFGSIKRHEKCMINTVNLEAYFRGTNIPKEVAEYEQLQKDLVITFSMYQGGWCWKAFAIAVAGVIQIAAGSLLIAYPIFGPYSYHIGSGLISEGASDIVFAITNSGNITSRSYWNNKLMSVFITVVSCGVGAYLSSGANAAVITANIAKEQAARFGLKLAAKEGSKMILKTVVKKVLGEVGKAVLNLVKSLAIDKLSQFVTAAVFKEFKDAIMWMIKKSFGYEEGMKKAEASLKNLNYLIVSTNQQNQNTIQILQEKINESEQELSESLNNQIASLTGKIGGPLASQIGEASQNVRFSGLKLNENSIGNAQAKSYSKIAELIGTALKIIKCCNTAIELISVVNDLIQLIGKKLSIKAESIAQTGIQDKKLDTTIEATNKQIDNQVIKKKKETDELRVIREAIPPTIDSLQKTNQSNEKTDEVKIEITQLETEKNKKVDAENENVKEGIEIINNRLFDNIQAKIQNQIVGPAFNSLVDHMMKPLSESLEKAFFQEFNDLKTMSLAYGEYDHRYIKDGKELGLEIDLVKDHLIDEMTKLSFDSPILEVNLDEVKQGTIILEIDGELKELDFANEQDRNLIRDKVGSKNIRILPGLGLTGKPRLSRPNFSNYMSSWSPDKQVNESDLEIMAFRENRQFVVMKPDGTQKIIGPKSDKEPFMFKYSEGVDKNTGHYSPIVKEGDSYVEINDLTNNKNACGIESLLYLKNREDLIGKGEWSQQAEQRLKTGLNLESINNELNQIKDFALKCPNVRNQFLNRKHEAPNTLIGGQKREILTNEQYPGENEINLNVRKVTEIHLEERVNNFLEFRNLCQKLEDEVQKSNPDFKLEYEESAKFQDKSGRHELNDSSLIPSSSFKNMDSNILEANIGELSHIDAAHTIGINVKNLDLISDSNSTPEALKVKQQIKDMLSKTNPLPKSLNIVPDRIIDKVQFKMVNEINGSMSDTEFKQSYLRECSKSVNEKLYSFQQNTFQAQVLQLYKEKLDSFKNQDLVEDLQNKRRKAG